MSYEANGNDASLIDNKVKGNVIYFKHDYGFICADDKSMDDLFFHVDEVGMGREGHIEFRGRERSKDVYSEALQKMVATEYFPGERVEFDVKKSGKMVTNKFTGEKREGLKAVNIKLL